MQRLLFVLVLLSVPPLDVSAQRAEEPDNGAANDQAELPLRRVDRDLVVPRGWVRADVALSVGNDLNRRAVVDDTFVAGDLGGGVGIFEGLEVGVSLNREWFWPRYGGGLMSIYWDGADTHFESIPFYGRFQFASGEHFAIALDLEVQIRTHEGPRRHGVRASLPVRIRGGALMFDTGITFEELTKGGRGGQPSSHLYIPAVLTANVTDAIYVRVASGVGFWYLGDFNHVFMPLFFGAGYSLEMPQTTVDLSLDVGFQQLAHRDTIRGSGSLDDRASPEWSFVKATATAHFDLF